MSTLDGIGMDDPDDDSSTLRRSARSVLNGHWLDEGYTMPNRATYPWQWLWDSCFHAIVWAELGDERALIEIEQLFRFQTPRGFVPHMSYHPDPAQATSFWGRPGASTITQPPMYGHAIAELIRRGMTPNEQVIDAAIRGFKFLLRQRARTAGGLVEVCHPWESGCDDSARWDGALARTWDREQWRRHKHQLVQSVVVDDEGGAIRNEHFRVGSLGFCALVAFNALELAAAVDGTGLEADGRELADIVGGQWDDDLRTWVDDGMLASGSGRARTTDAHFGVLVDPDPRHREISAADLVDEDAYGGACGPAGAHRDEPTFDPITYWRGPAWPQMSYLLWVGLERHGHDEAAATVAAALRRGSLRSGLAEFWHPDTGQGAGAIPQSWAALALVVPESQVPPPVNGTSNVRK